MATNPMTVAGVVARPGTPVVARRALFSRLTSGIAAGVALVVGPPGSGKTVLLRSWIEDAGLWPRVAWVSVDRDERDAQHFWLSVVRALRSAVSADGIVERLTPTPAFDGDGLVERLLAELGSLDEPIVLVVDDLHELRAAEARAQLERLLSRRPALLRVVLASRRDPQLGLHRLRLTGELTEVRTADLRFTLEETRELLARVRDRAAGRGGAAAPGPHGGVGGGAAAGGALTGRPSRARAPRRRIHWQRAHRRRVSAGGGAGAPAGGRAAAVAAHVDPREGQRGAG